VDLGDLAGRVAKLETRVKVNVSGTPLVIPADRDQLEQVLINLVKNGAEASLEIKNNAPCVTVEWSRVAGSIAAVEIVVRDTGPGLSNTANLFVPFFTTKPGGSGIGLVLCRQIIEAHGGTLALRNVTQGQGCEAVVTLPCPAP
jgi:two-component system, NtrC family, nitrogen regulation sensor histidine kinase NtrY